MPDEVILDVTTIEENVTVETTAGDVVEIQVVAPAGPAGATGATGAAGPNSVTSATTSDGTANLSIADLEVVGGEIYTDGEYSHIYTQGDGAEIFTIGSDALIYTQGEDAHISTSGANATIYTSGANGSIYTIGANAGISTAGANANIGTQGSNATISTIGSAAHIQTSHASAAVKSTNFAAVESGGASLVDGSFQPCLTWSAGGRNLTIPSGTATTFNTTSYTYGTGAAAAHRTALGLTTLATTTPAANVATFLATPTSANLAAAVTGETGSGALVFGTSPSLTSPTIGTSATFNATTYTYGAGAAAAHVTALGLPVADNIVTITGAQWRDWPMTFTVAPAGCVVVDSGNTASAVNVLNYSNNTYPLAILSCAGDFRGATNYDRRHRVAFDIFIANASGACEGWVVCGETFNKATVTNPDKKSFGIKITSSGVALWVHDGTNLNVATATSMPSAETLYTIYLEYWSGTLSGTLNGTSLAPATSGPSGLGVSNATGISFQAKTGATNERCRFGVMFPRSITTAS
jgi:hypothetical protein